MRTETDPRAAARQILALLPRRRRATDRQRGRLREWRGHIIAPARALGEAARAVRRLGRVTAADQGVGVVRQFAATWWLHLRYDYDHETVYRYRLFSRDRVLPSPLYLPLRSAALLYRVVVPRADQRAAGILADKRRFARWCAAQGLPTVPILAEFEDGAVTRWATEDAWPAGDLFAKWGTRYGGGSTQRWVRHGDDYRGGKGEIRSLDEILAQLAERSRKGVVLLQPRMVNHSDLRPLSPNALSTLRIMTTRRPDDAPRFLAGVLRMGVGEATADNFAQGGIASAVDTDTGVAGPARRVDRMYRTRAHERHPDTGAIIDGLLVPFWRESVELAVEAHARLGQIPCVGWDVAVLEGGPVLLEGNWNPCTKLVQVATQTPLLATEFAGAYGAWLAQPVCAFDDEWLIGQRRWTPP